MPISESDLLGHLPAVRHVTVDEVTSAVATSNRRLVILDDDPTGTQTVADIPVLTSWEVDDLVWAFAQSTSCFYILTNSRALSEADMVLRNREVMVALHDAAKRAEVLYTVVSRSDSTLRGHYPLETDTLADALVNGGDSDVDAVVLVPAYVEAGRITVQSRHYVRSAGGFVPVGESEFASDATFGFISSDLREYVAEKTKGAWSADQVLRVTIEDIRQGGIECVEAIVRQARGRQPIVVDAVVDDDLRVVALALLRAEAQGSHFLYRVGPSFVRARGGLETPIPRAIAGLHDVWTSVSRNVTGVPASTHGVVVVGSHVTQTTRQLDALMANDDIVLIEVDVIRLLDIAARQDEIIRASAALVRGLALGDVVLATSRDLVRGATPDESLAIAQSISSALVCIVRQLTSHVTPRWLIAKGGITSSDLATQALGIRRAWIRGPILDGIISLWEPVPTSSTQPVIAYVVFAGNVGDEGALVTVIRALREDS